jgi:hypothetical protein
MGNPNHDERGKFASGSASGAATGDHGAVSPSTARRNVPGHGTVARSKVVAMHSHTPSVGTSSGGGGGGGDGGGGGRLGLAAREKVALNRRVDQGHFPPQSNTDIGMKTVLGGHPSSGKLDPRQSDLISAHGGTGGKPRIRARAR